MARVFIPLKGPSFKNERARNLLQGFINQVNSQRGKTLNDTKADELIAIAQRIIVSIPKK
jgi:hypothetical protein